MPNLSLASSHPRLSRNSLYRREAGGEHKIRNGRTVAVCRRSIKTIECA